MITEKDVADLRYYDKFKEDGTPQNELAAYSQWAEGLVLTKGYTRLLENILGIVGEAGEVAEKLKKSLRDGATFDKEGVKLELGDVLYYIAITANGIGSNLQEIAELNIKKLNSRKERGVLQGSGDNR
tara:strand:- start:221 stop:604 length:384 start_codon:yes stop_codon:yes gene_type:complete